ncbi:Indoleamine 2,3-dioxygenase [Schizophyllum commune]
MDPLLDLPDALKAQLPPNHFLAQPRPDANAGVPDGVVDTTTLAAHDFDVDNRTGFMPPQPPLTRLPAAYEPWVVVLNDAIAQRLQVGDKPGLPVAEAAKSATWRARVDEMPLLPTESLRSSERVLRRAHQVLAWILHFYVHTLPPDAPSITIPEPLSLPLLRVSAALQLPPVLTYSDTVLYNWAPKDDSRPSPAADNLRSNLLFTGTRDEEEFYLTSARMELCGVEALELMRCTLDELFVGDDLALKRIASYLRRLAVVIKQLQTTLVSVREGCDPAVFFNDARPWMRGADSGPNKRPWVFAGLDSAPDLAPPTELSGPSAGQSALIHALDVFLGLARETHDAGAEAAAAEGRAAFLRRMQRYMPRHHRRFLDHLAAGPRPLRALVLKAGSEELTGAYNDAVRAMKELRDAHMVIVTLYIIQPARKAERAAREARGEAAPAPEEAKPLKGTGGTELAQFLKGVRDRTARGLLPAQGKE